MKSELFLALALLAGAVAPALAGEDCVELVEHSIGEPDEGYGIGEIRVGKPGSENFSSMRYLLHPYPDCPRA
ncbi:hypothetical protein [Thiohalobacter thiocyanaticus]|nr:hypothetical protein [Thiohalobacter thiocyanaticus]